jgi:hypothetical protein
MPPTKMTLARLESLPLATCCDLLKVEEPKAVDG